MSRNDKERVESGHWFEYRLPVWRSTADRLARLERGKAAPPEVVLDIVRSYPEIARDLAIARRTAPNGPLTKYLERVYLGLHRAIFRPPTAFFRTVLALFADGAAAAAFELRRHIVAVVALFVLCTAAGGWLVHTYPELVTLFASEEMIDHVQRGELWTDGLLNVFPSSLLAVRIFTNNIAVSLFALCLGVAYGLGTFYIIGMNGFMLGGVFAYCVQHGLGRRLFEFTAAHGFVELSVICISGAIGASLGEALARPGELTRAAAFRAAVARGAQLMVVCLVFLVGAGVLEGYVSPDRSIALAPRLAIGLGYFLLFALVLSGAVGRVLDRRR